MCMDSKATKTLNMNAVLIRDEHMVQAIINIPEHTNRLLNVVKARYGLKDKSQAIEKMAEEYEAVLERPFRPAMQKKLERIYSDMKKGIGVTSMTQEEAVRYFRRNAQHRTKR